MQSAAAKATFPGILKEVLDVDCNLAIWERTPIADAASLLNGAIEDVRFNTELVKLEQRLASNLSSAGYDDGPARSVLIADITELAELYCSIMNLKELSVRIEVVTTDSCRKWHSDYVKARLISTYVGPATQWLDSANAEHVRGGEKPRQINQMGTGDVGIFKGKLATDAPAIHRSPPIVGSGEKRLLLVLNPREER